MYLEFPRMLVDLLMAPGVVVRVAMQHLVCRMLQIPIVELVYFQRTYPAGYIVPDCSANLRSRFFLAILLPPLVNTVLALALSMASSLVTLVSSPSVVDITCLYLGISIGAQAIPSRYDVAMLLDDAVRHPDVPMLQRVVVGSIAYPLALLSALSDVVPLHVLYGIGVAIYWPRAIAGY